MLKMLPQCWVAVNNITPHLPRDLQPPQAPGWQFISIIPTSTIAQDPD